MDCNTRLVFISFFLIIIFFMHLNMQNLSRVYSSCSTGHERTLDHLEDFRNSLLESDLLVSFVDKTDLAHLERERREAEKKVAKLIHQLKTVQEELVCLYRSFLTTTVACICVVR